MDENQRRARRSRRPRGHARIAIEHNLVLLEDDRDFGAIAPVEKRLKLFKAA
jgi:hypothetical protein